jgi:hypothetical protein
MTWCNNNSFIDLQDQLNMFRAKFCPSSGAQDWDFYNIWYNVLLFGRQGIRASCLALRVRLCHCVTEDSDTDVHVHNNMKVYRNEILFNLEISLFYTKNTFKMYVKFTRIKSIK